MIQGIKKWDIDDNAEAKIKNCKKVIDKFR